MPTPGAGSCGIGLILCLPGACDLSGPGDRLALTVRPVVKPFICYGVSSYSVECQWLSVSVYVVGPWLNVRSSMPS